MPVVVCLPTKKRTPWPPLAVPASDPDPRPWIAGGVRSLHEIAFAIATTGRTVELRGAFHEPSVRALEAATGARVTVRAEPRALTTDDIVIAPEGFPDPLPYASVALSPARAVLLMLAPPGMFGWPFVAGWQPTEPHAIDVASIARAEHFRAAVASGFELWTNAGATARAAQDAGVSCVAIGTGSPGFPQPQRERTHDVALVVRNRWADDARAVASRLRASVLEIDDATPDEMLRLLGSARILIWPSRIEGHARVQTEARALGTVPVALPNPFATGLDESGGAVVVGTLDEMPDAIEATLADPQRLRALSDRAIATARAEIDWDSYVARVDAALSSPVPDESRDARAGFGERLARVLDEHEAEHARARETITYAEGKIAKLEDTVAHLGTQVAAERAARAQTEESLKALRARRSVRLALRAAEGLRPLRRKNSD